MTTTYSSSVSLNVRGDDVLTVGANVPVLVKLSGTETRASIFDINDQALTNPFNTDANGNYLFKVEDGLYDIVINSGQPSEYTVEYEARTPQDNQSLVRSFSTTAEMVSEDLQVGQVVKVDGLEFTIVAPNTGIADNSTYYDLDNGNQAKLVIESKIKNTQPLFLEQFINSFGGRGMLSAETARLVTEINITSNNAAGETTVGVNSTTNFEVGSRVTIYHQEDDIYQTYFVNSKSSVGLGFSSPLRYPVNTLSKVERTWFDQAHPGKFYMRSLAQSIARKPESELQLATNGRLFFSQFDSDPTSESDTVTGVNGASVAYINELNVSQGNIGVPVESSVGRSVFLSVDANGEGGELPSFNTFGVSSAILRFQVMCRLSSAQLSVQLVDEGGLIQNEIDLPVSTIRVPTVYTYPVSLSSSSKNLTPRVVAKNIASSTSIILDFFEVFSADAIATPAIAKDKHCVIVGLGDSWIAGDTATTAERESILTQLQVELPLATIINKGVGGQKVWEMYNRFDADVAPHDPDYVIVNTGTNDAYSPISSVFFPNSVDEYERYYNLLISKIKGIGARPIIIGTPALSEADSDDTNWALNDKAKSYSRYFYKRISGVPDYTQSIDLPADPVLTDFTPVFKINNSESGIAYAARSGKYTQNGRVVSFTIDLTLSSKGASTGLVTLDMPPLTNTGGITPFYTTAINVTSAQGMQAIGSISATDQMRLQIPVATGTQAATEANINNDSRFIVSGSYLVTV